MDKSKVITSRQYLQKYPDTKPKMDIERANQYLQDLKKVFDKHNITFFLFFGTLLGAVREEDIIAYDDDVDIGILDEDEAKIMPLEKEFKDMGYYVMQTTSQGRLSSAYIAKKAHREKVDICTLFRSQGKRWFIRYGNDSKNGAHIKAIPYTAKYFEKFETIHFKGEDYRVPSPPEEFLTELWGEEWYIARGGQFGVIPGVLFKPPESFKMEAKQ